MNPFDENGRILRKACDKVRGRWLRFNVPLNSLGRSLVFLTARGHAGTIRGSRLHRHLYSLARSIRV